MRKLICEALIRVVMATFLNIWLVYPETGKWTTAILSVMYLGMEGNFVALKVGADKKTKEK